MEDAYETESIHLNADMEEESFVEEPVKSKKAKTNQRKQIVLYREQVQHFEKIREIHKQFPFAIDLSMLGAGKTFTSSFLALTEQYEHVVVVCPVSVGPKWTKMKNEFGVPIKEVLSYQGLRSTKFKQPKHGLLSRRDESTFVLNDFGLMVESDIVTFSSTPLYKKMVQEGCLLILDEIQHIKNISTQFFAASELIKEITVSKETQRVKQGEAFASENGKSRVLLLSGSPMDKKEHALHLFRSLGIMVSDRVAQFNPHTRELEWRGMREIFDFCAVLGVCPPKQIQDSYEKFSFTLFQTIFKPACSSFMLPPRTDFVLDKRNAYYNIDEEGSTILKRGLVGLKTAAQFDGVNVNLNIGTGHVGRAMAAVMRSLQIIETGKIQLFAKIARKALNETPNAKIVIAVNFSETINDLVELLKDFEPLILRGSTSSNQRGIVLRDFEKASTAKRLLIANLTVASSGIDLDDKHGDFPRMAFVSPNYSTITSYQFGFRFLRADTKSSTKVHFVFAKYEDKTKEQSADIVEVRVLNALAHKSLVMKQVTQEQALDHVVFPGDHPDWVEGDDDHTDRVQGDDCDLR